MRLLDIETCEIQEIKGASECRDAFAKCAIISHRWGGHELSFQQYEERMKSSNYKSQKFDDPGDTSFRSEGESEGFLKLTSTGPLEGPTSTTNTTPRELEIHLDGHLLY